MRALTNSPSERENATRYSTEYQRELAGTACKRGLPLTVLPCTYSVGLGKKNKSNYRPFYCTRGFKASRLVADPQNPADTARSGLVGVCRKWSVPPSS